MRLGFITAVSDSYCATCNRVRLTATGGIQACLAHPEDVSLRDMMRKGADDSAIRATIRRTLHLKIPEHDFSVAVDGPRTLQSMSVTGG